MSCNSVAIVAYMELYCILRVYLKENSMETALAKIIADKYDENPDLYAGKPTDPRRFDEEEIYKRRLSYGKAGFALQFMLNTNLSDQEKYPLKVQDLMIANLSLDEANLKWILE